MNAFLKITVALATSAALALTFSCSSDGGGGSEPPPPVSSSEEIGVSSSSVVVTGGSSSSEVVTGVSSSSEVDTGTSSSSVTGAVVRTTLLAEIEKAETEKESVVVSVNGSEVNPADKWVTQAEMTALESAITAAETVNANENATQAQVDAAKATLTTAIATFTAAKKAGTNPGAAVKGELEATLGTAETAMLSVTVSANGSDVAQSDKWVTQAEMTALETAITAAEAIKDKANATQAEVDNAKTALQTAITTFNAAKKAGTQASAAAKTTLGAKITEATDAKTGVSVSINGEDIEPTKYWATQSAITTLETAIATAQAVKDKANATQTEVDNAIATLNTAITAFTKQLGAETSTAKEALGTAITNANNAKADVKTATSSTEAFIDEFWVTSAQMTAITTAIATATTANTTATTKKGFDDATAALNTAITAFNDAKQAGTVPLCGGSRYDLATQYCYNSSKVGNYCGVRTEEYNPDIYECKPSINPNGIYLKSKPIDPDGNEYEAVLIGEQVWMAENLNYNADGSLCYSNSNARCNTYGRLYNWETAMDEAATSTANPSGVQGVCPSGWHLPSGMEWQALMNFVDSTSLTSPATSNTAGKKLKANSDLWITNIGTDDFGFAALPGGFGFSGGSFYDVGGLGYWWSATESSANDAYNRNMLYNSEGAYWDNSIKTNLHSVRCVRD